MPLEDAQNAEISPVTHETPGSLDILDVPIDDSRLAEIAFPNLRALCSETFMSVSKDNYPLPWLVREIVQNFVDGNQTNPKSLDNVTSEETSDGMTSTFTFTGDWPIMSANYLISFGSDKIDTPTHLSGGNGIGIKQAILRFMRDFGVKRFIILGQGWEVEYRMAGKDEINRQLDEQSPSVGAVQHGSFMVQHRRSGNRDRCKYIVETDNPEVQAALREFRDLGACRENKYLQNPHFENEHIAIKWLKIEGTDDPKKKQTVERGRLFVNGQIYRCSRYNGRDDDYWRGPDGVTIHLKNVKYEMTMDRPPMENYILRNHIRDSLRTLSRDELIANLQASEYLWTGLRYKRANFETPFCFDVIELIVEKLKIMGFTSEDYEALFGGKKYLHEDKPLTESQYEDLRKAGYTICPDYFRELGMPKASAKLSSIQVAAGKKPDYFDVMDAVFEASTKAGVIVPYFKLNPEATPQTIAEYVRKKLDNSLIQSVTVQPERDTVHIALKPKDIPKHALISVKDKPEEFRKIEWMIYLIRGLIQVGLKVGWLEDAHMAQGEYITTFMNRNDELYVRNNEAPTDNAYVELKLAKKAFAEFVTGLQKRPPGEYTEPEEKAPIEDYTFPSKFDKIWKYAKWPAIATIASATVLGIAFCLSMLDIPKMLHGEKTLKDLEALVDKYKRVGVGGHRSPELIPDEDTIHDAEDIKGFHIVAPTINQYRQLQLLKEYLFLTTGYEVQGMMFVFRGEGSNGINIVGNIGIHYELFSMNFEGAMSTFSHEVVHNSICGHNSEFINIYSALTAAREDALGDIARTPASQRDSKSRRILEIEAEWNSLII